MGGRTLVLVQFPLQILTWGCLSPVLVGEERIAIFLNLGVIQAVWIVLLSAVLIDVSLLASVLDKESILLLPAKAVLLFYPALAL